MSKKKKKQKKNDAGISKTAWIPPFFIGLVCGIFLHFVPGMDHIFSDAYKSLSEGGRKASTKRETVIWGQHQK